MMVADHINYLTFEDPAAVNLVRRALKLAQAGDLYGAAETAGVDVGHAAVVSEGLRRGMRYSIGAEVDNDPRSRPDAQNIVDAMRPDGMIRSVHFLPVPHPQFGEHWMWPFDNPEFKDHFDVVGVERTWELYVATLLEAIEKLPGHIVGHVYVPAVFGHWPSDEILEDYEDRILAACAERNMAVEVNSRYFYRHNSGDEEQLARFRRANVRLLRKAKERGVAIAVGSDAHSPKDQGNGFEQVLALLDEADVNEIAFPVNGRLARVALRVTDEILREAAAEREAAAVAVAARARGDVDADDEADEKQEPLILPEGATTTPEPIAVEVAAPAENDGVVPAVARAAGARKRPSRAKPKATGVATAEASTTAEASAAAESAEVSAAQDKASAVVVTVQDAPDSLSASATEGEPTREAPAVTSRRRPKDEPRRPAAPARESVEPAKGATPKRPAAPGRGKAPVAARAATAAETLRSKTAKKAADTATASRTAKAAPERSPSRAKKTVASAASKTAKRSSAAKRVAATKSPSKKAPSSKKAPVRKAPLKKTAVKKAAAKRSVAKKPATKKSKSRR